MKQTSNAIKFLLAQYRSIFKNAYFKGLATAAVVTAGLATGQAQAADTVYASTNNDISVAYGSTFTPYQPSTSNNATGAYGNETKTSISGGSLTIGTDNTVSSTTNWAAGAVIVTSGSVGSLTISNRNLTLEAGAVIGKGAYGAYINASGGGNVFSYENGLTINADANKTVTVTAGGTGDGLFGARVKSSNGSATASGNYVTINADVGSTLALGNGGNGIVGALAEGTNGVNVTGNKVEINGLNPSDGSLLKLHGQLNSIQGGFALNQVASGSTSLIANDNHVTLNNVDLNSSKSGSYIFGGRAFNDGTDAGTSGDEAGTFTAQGNTVSLTNTNVTTTITDSDHLQIVGNMAIGFGKSGGNSVPGQDVIANGTGEVSVLISGGTFDNNGNKSIANGSENSMVVGGYANTISGSATANQNVVQISNADFHAVNLYGARVVAAGDENTATATGNSLTITNTSQDHGDSATQALVTSSVVAGAYVTLTGATTSASVTADSNSVSISNTNTSSTPTTKIINGTVYGAFVSSNLKQLSGAVITANTNKVEIGSGVEVKNSVFGVSSDYNGTFKDNSVSFAGTLNSAADAKPVNKIVGVSIETGESGADGDNQAKLTITGNTVTIGADAKLANTNIVAVDLAENNATHNSIIHSGNNVLVEGVVVYNDTDAAEADKTYSLAGDDVQVANNAVIYVQNGILNISGIANGADTGTKYFNGTGTVAASAKIANNDTINVFNALKIEGDDSLIATKNGALLVVDAGSAAAEAKGHTPVTSEKATLYISEAGLTGYLTATKDKNYDLYSGSTGIADAAGAVQVTKLGTVDFGDTVTLNNFNFTKTAPLAGQIQVDDSYSDIEGSESGSIFRASTVNVEHALVTDNSRLNADLSNINKLKLDETEGIAIEANVLNLGSSGLSSSQSAAITFGQATARDEINFIAASSGQDTKTDGSVNTGVNNDGYHLTSQVIGSNYMLTNTQDGALTYYTAQSGVIKGDVTVEGTSGEIWIKNGNWTAQSDITLAGGKLTVGSGDGITPKPTNVTYGPDATLTLSHGLTLDVSQAVTSEVNVSGSMGRFDRDYADQLDSNASWETERVALLDLTAGLTLLRDTTTQTNGGISGSASINATSGGIILLDADDVNTILSINDKNNASGAFFSGSDGGTFIVNGNVEADFGDFGDGTNNGFNLASGSRTGDDYFNGGVLVAENLKLQHSNDTNIDSKDASYISGDENHVSLGGVVIVNDLEINDLQQTTGDKPTGAGTYASKVYLDNGYAVISHSLTSYNQTLVLGGDETKAATLDFETNAFTDAGTIDIDVISADKGGSVIVRNGKWDASATTFDLSGAGATLTVGDEYIDHEDVNGDQTDATLKASTIKMAAGTSLDVLADGTATFADANFDKLTAVSSEQNLNDIQAGVEVKGTLNITNSVDFGGAGSIYIAKNGVLNFGSAATNANIVKDGNYTNTAATVITGYSQIRNMGGTLRLDLADSTVFGGDQIKALKTALFTSDSMTNGVLKSGGILNIGQASFNGVAVDELVGEGLSGYTASWADLDDFSDVYGDDVINDTLLQTNVNSIGAGVNVQGHWGSLSMVSGVANSAQVEIAGHTSLNFAEGNNGLFISTADNKTALGANIQSQKSLKLVNGGTIGRITLQPGLDDAEKNLTVLEVTGPNLTTIESIDGVSDGDSYHDSNTEVRISGDTNVTKDIRYIENVVVTNGATLTATNAEISDLSTLNSHVKINDTLTVADSEVIGGSVTAKNVVLNGRSDTTTLSEANLNIVNGGKFTADMFTFQQDNAGVVFVGEDLSETEATMDDGSKITGTGYFEVNTLDLNGGVLAVDPAYGELTSIAAVGKFQDSKSYTYGWNDKGEINGKLLIGKNAAAGIGATVDETLNAISTYQENGSLSADNYGSILYLNGQVTLLQGSEIALNANDSVSTTEGIRDSLKYNLVEGSNDQLREDQYADLGLGAHTAILMTEQAFEDKDGNKNGVAISFDRTSAVVNGAGGDIVLVGSFDASQPLNFFKDNDAAGSEGVKIIGSVDVYTQNGFLHTTLSGDNAGYGESLKVETDRAYQVMHEASDPVVASLISYHVDRGGAVAGDDTTDSGDSIPASQSATENVLADSRNGANVGVGGGDSSTGGDGSTGGDTGSGSGGAGNGSTGGDTGTTNPSHKLTGSSTFLNEVITTSHGAPAEAVARMALYGGAVQAAIAANTSSYEAIAARTGVGATDMGLTVANNGMGAALWLAPMYKNQDSDSFDAEGLSYGVDMNLYGVALGADFEFMPGLTAGIMFNVGSGSADGQGNAAASSVSNDFDYYGISVYGNYKYDALSITADLGYTAVDSDIDAHTGLESYGTVSTSVDSTAWTLGVTGKYTFNVGGVELAPHAGLRYSSIDLDDYSVSDIASYDADTMDIFSIPVGVTIAKEFQGESWSVKPSLDLSVQGNFGDDSSDGTVHWTGVDGLATNVSSEMMDNFTYGATLGVSAQTGSFSMGLGVNYTGSDNVDEFGVNANARFVF